MNLGELEQELGLIVNNDKSLQPFFRQWLNEAILEIATDFDLPALKLLTPQTLVTGTDNWIYDAPDGFQKKIFRCADGNWNPVRIRRMIDELDALDIDHDDTGDNVTDIAVMDTGVDKKICIYPKASDTLRLWYYQEPTPLNVPADIPKCIPAAYHSRLILPKVVIKNFQLLQDMVVDAPHRSLDYWHRQYHIGLFGEPRGDIGFMNFLAKAKGVRVHGGRDPLGQVYA